MIGRAPVWAGGIIRHVTSPYLAWDSERIKTSTRAGKYGDFLTTGLHAMLEKRLKHKPASMHQNWGSP
jgi:hypothetical protein